MNGKTVFGDFDRSCEPVFERIATVNVIDEPQKVDIFENLVELGGSECWVWQGMFSPKGFPVTRTTQRDNPDHYVHRIVWRMFGHVKTDGRIIQKCQTTGCVAPEHFVIENCKRQLG